MAKISPSEVRTQISNFINNADSVKAKFENINTAFVSNMEPIWNTPTASKFIDNACVKVNDMINQYNKAYQEGLSTFQNNVNTFFRANDVPTLNVMDVPVVSNLSRTWAAQTDPFNSPDTTSQVTNFTEDNFTNKVNEICDLLDTMGNNMSAAVENGLDSKYCTSIRETMKSLARTGRNVLEGYTKESVETAVDADTLFEATRGA